MIAGFPVGARLSPFDRNWTAKNGYYGAAAVGPHGFTTRLTYTVPSQTKAVLDATTVQMYRDVVATTALLEAETLSYQPSGGSSFPILTWQQLDNTLGVSRMLQMNGQVILFAGDVLTWVTANTDTGGSFTYNIGYKIYEFTA